MSDLECPYCDADLEVCHDDGFGYSEDCKHEMQCSECDKYFVFNTSISFNYYPEKADCLNGSNHDYRATRTYPVEYTKMECTMCEVRRTPTTDEMADILKERAK